MRDLVIDSLSPDDRIAVGTILARRANEIANFKTENPNLPGSVDYALTLEIRRLRKLESCIAPKGYEADLKS